MKSFTFLIGLSVALTGCTVEPTVQSQIKESKNQLQTKAYILGHWTGILETPAGNMKLWLTVDMENNGHYSAQLESVDQMPGHKEKIEKLTFENNELHFSIPKFSAKYTGQWDAQKQQWEGHFSQGKKLALIFSYGKPEVTNKVAGLDGQWKGYLGSYPLIIRVMSGESGTIALLDSPDDGKHNINISALKHKNGDVSFEIPQGRVKFKGLLKDDGSTLTGYWLQQGQAKKSISFSKLK